MEYLILCTVIVEKFTTYKGKSGRATSLKYNHLKDLDLDSLSFKKKLPKNIWQSSKGVIQEFINLGNNNDIDYMGKLNEALHQLSTMVAKGTSSKDMQYIVTRAEDIFDEIVEVDLKLAKGRKKVYKYWKGISHKYDTLVDTISELQEISKETEIPKEMKVSIDKLQVPPNYIKELQPLIKNTGDATVIVPMIKDYLEVSVKNDDALVKLAAVVQRIITATNKDDDGSEFGLSLLVCG